MRPPRLRTALAFSLVPFALHATTVTVAPDAFAIDHALHLIVVAQDIGALNAQSMGPVDRLALGAADYQLGVEVEEFALGEAYPVTDGAGVAYSLHFTDLPMVFITTEGTVVDEPKVPGMFRMRTGTTALPALPIGIEFRGASSQAYDKKSFGIEFWTDATGSATIDVSLLGLRADDDWDLNAMWIEPLRLRNVLMQELWMDIHAPHYASQAPMARSGVRLRHVELFLNGSYRGLYALGEQVDRKQLALRTYNGTIRGSLAKGVSWGASTMTAGPPYDNGSVLWSGFEHVYPEEAIDWGGLYGLVDLVLHGTEQQFLNDLPFLFEQDNAVDYFLFLNLLRALDNTGKNIQVARYDAGSPYFYVPWDLDAVLGLNWDGSLIPYTQGILDNGMYERQLLDCRENGFVARARARWQELRTGPFTVPALMQRFQTAYERLHGSGAYDREQLAWPDYTHSPGLLGYLGNWLQDRVAYLDAYFDTACDGMAVAGDAMQPLRIGPNPTGDRCHIELTRAIDAGLLTMYDATGRMVRQQAFNGHVGEVDVRSLGVGPYVVVLQEQGRTLFLQRLQVVR